MIKTLEATYFDEVAGMELVVTCSYWSDGRDENYRNFRFTPVGDIFPYFGDYCEESAVDALIDGEEVSPY